MPSKKSAKKPAKKAVKKSAASKKPAAPKYVYQTRHDITKPKPGSGNTARIWEICENLTEKTGSTAIRKEVIAQAVKEKIPAATGSTQYFCWRVFNGLGGKLKPKMPKMPKAPKLPKPPKKAVKAKKAAAAKLPKPPKKAAAPVVPFPVTPEAAEPAAAETAPASE